MDPVARVLNTVRMSNLRSRGDGPRACFCPTTRSAKPPLTRRWTRSNNVPDRVALQTSAHAEMDPRWARRSPARWPNLRSRGDGPISVMMYLTWFTKPPLTRRWTRATGHARPDRAQTSAHAEMDLPCLPSGPCGPANLRSRGDEPQMHDADGR